MAHQYGSNGFGEGSVHLLPSSFHHPSPSSGSIPAEPIETPPPLLPRRPLDMSGVAFRRHGGNMGGGNDEMLPGTMGKQLDYHAQIRPHPTIVSTTELDHHSVSQRGAEERKPYLPPSHPLSQPPPPPLRPRSAGSLGTRAPPVPPTTLSQAWTSNSATKPPHSGSSEVRAAVTSTVEERLKSLLTTPSPGKALQPAHNNAAFDYEDGELLLPPPRPPRPSQESVNGFQQRNESPTRDEHEFLQSSYVPSRPAERHSAGSRGQAILNRVGQPAFVQTAGLYHPHQYPHPHGGNMPSQYNNHYAPPPPPPPKGGGNQGPVPPPPPRYNPPPQYGNRLSSGGQVNPAFMPSPKSSHKVGAATNSSNDLRSACRSLYGNEGSGRPASQTTYPAPSPGTAPSQSPHVWPKYGSHGPEQPRSSPMGQSNSTTPSQTSSQSPNSPALPRPHSHNLDQKALPERRPVVPGNLSKRTAGPIEEFRPIDRLSGPNNSRMSNEKLTHMSNGSSVDHHSGGVTSAPDPGKDPHSIYAQVNNRDSHNAQREVGQSSQRMSSLEDFSWGNHTGPPEGTPSNKIGSVPSPRRGQQGPLQKPPPSQSRENIELQTLRADMLNSRRDSNNKSAVSKDFNSHYDTPSNMAHRVAQLSIPQPKWRGSLASDDGQYSPSLSSRSVTPPLPPLSPSNTPPITPPDSPDMGRRINSVPPGSQNYLTRTPDVVTSTAKKNSPGGKKKQIRKNPSGVAVKAFDGRMKKSAPSGKPNSRISHTQAFRNARSLGSLDNVEESDDLDFSDDQGNTTNASGTEGEINTSAMDQREVRIIRQQLEGLETMYHEILKLLGVDKEYIPGSRRSISSQSSISRTGRRLRHTHSHKHRSKEIKQVNKRFARLESHVVTLARSVAHLSSEMRSHNNNSGELDEIKRDIKRLQEIAASGGIKQYVNEFERFRGWVPSLTNPRRVNKLTKFFGQEPPLLHIFLKKLGYERYAVNFEQEKIGMIELPYMNEDRLQKIGIPMGPRLRILQEAQMCFRQENFDIYIV